MTAPTSPAAPRRRNKSKARGTAAEKAVVNFLRAHGFGEAERRALRGTADAGDVTGTPGVCWEVKTRDRPVSDEQINTWLAETETERINARADIGVLVVRRPGVGPANAGSWWAVMRANAWILGARKHDFPVRLLLADAVYLLRKAGYGDALNEEVS